MEIFSLKCLAAFSILNTQMPFLKKVIQSKSL